MTFDDDLYEKWCANPKPEMDKEQVKELALGLLECEHALNDLGMSLFDIPDSPHPQITEGDRKFLENNLPSKFKFLLNLTISPGSSTEDPS